MHSILISWKFCYDYVGMQVLETLHLAPAGTSKVQTMLQKGGMGIAEGGETGVFTPMYLAVVQKPCGASATSSGAATSSTPRGRGRSGSKGRA